MNSEGQRRDSHNQNDRTSYGTTNQTQGRQSHQDDTDDKRHAALFDARSNDSLDDDDGSKGSYKSNKLSREKSRHSQNHVKQPDGSSDARNSLNSSTPGDPRHHSHVHFKERAMSHQSTTQLPPLPPGTKPRSRDSDEANEDLARASWTTASFTEVPNALEELTTQHHPTKEQQLPPLEPEKKKLSVDHGSGPADRSDLHSVLAKHKQSHASVLTKYLRPTMSDEGTQAGIPSWDWLTRLEQMLIHFFLMVFESSNDSSKLIMEMMSTEAGEQIEEIFQLLLKAEPDMYKELGHLVALAEKWLIHWRGDSEERKRALEYVRLYMQGVKDKNYYQLPVQVRLHKLGAFIAGLNVMGGGEPIPRTLPPLKFPTYRLVPPAAAEPQFRVGSPRVKPATHFSQVVANILCGRPCDDPLPKADVYADKFGRHVFKNTLHGDREFKTYTDKKYGNLYQRKELFSKENPRLDSLVTDGSGDAGERMVDRSDCVQNVHCWIPKYTKSYVQTLQDNGCEVLAKSDFEKSVRMKECRLGKGGDDACDAIKTAKPKKLYDWVRGPDGKVHRRVVGSYTELGTVASMSKITDQTGHGHNDGSSGGGRRGRSDKMRERGNNMRGDNMRERSENTRGRSENTRGRSANTRRRGDNMRARGDNVRGGGKKGGTRGGGNARFPRLPKAVSDTRLERRSYDTRKSPTERLSKSRFTTRSKDVLGKDEKSERTKKSKNTAAAAMDAFNMEVISMDGSGDSGQEEVRLSKEKRKLEEKADKKGPLNTRQQKGKGETSKFGTNYHGPSNYKPRPPDRDRTGRPAERDQRNANRFNRSHTKEDASRARTRRNQSNAERGGMGSGDFKERDKGFVNIFDKKSPRNTVRRPFNKSFKRGRYTLDDEWEGEGYPGWSPRGSSDNFYQHMDRDDEHRRNTQLLTINQCWEKASKLFKKPSRALVIPPAENLMLYLEKKYPKARWSRGDPVATRNYPNGSVFVAQYRNGSSKVFYPHGGLAAAISAPSPITSQILVVRDPSDHMFFFDKALIAEMNSGGKGIIYGEDGVIQAQYSAIGGFKLDNLQKGKRWHWNQGGQRMLLKLNKYMSLRISDQDKIFLNFFGNHRGFLVNVASGQGVLLMSPNSESTRVDPIMHELKNLIRPATMDDNFDYIRGKLNPRPTLGFVDKTKHYANLDGNTTGQDVDVNLSPEEMIRMMYTPLSRGSNTGCGDMMSYVDNFPGYTTVNRDKTVITPLPIATYNTVC